VTARRLPFAVVATAITALGGAAEAGAARLGPGAWSWFGDPRAVHYDGEHRRTYVGWIDRRGAVRLTSVDHDSGARRGVVLKRGLGRDDHNNPSLLMLPDGRLQVFYSPHSGRILPPPGIPSRMYWRRMRRAEDLSSFGPERVLRTNTRGGLGYTYPNPVHLRRERRTWLFWRGGNWLPSFSTRRPTGRWSRARTLLAPPGGRRPYLKVASNGRDTIHFAFSEDNPGNRRVGIWYVRYRRGRLERADGRRVGRLSRLPLGQRSFEAVRRPRRGRPSAWVHDVAADRRGRPAIVYVAYRSRRDLRYRYARWDGRRWRDRQIVRAGGPLRGRYAGGISLDHEDPGVVFLSRRVRGVFEVERWTTRDGGRTWSRRPVTRRSRRHNVRPVAPRGEPSSRTVVWMRGRYRSYRAYITSIAGRGFSKRSRALERPVPLPLEAPSRRR
jgi:hypothetical protein